VLFRADNLGAARDYFAAMFGLGPAPGAAVLLAAELYRPFPLLIMAICGLLVVQPVQAHDWSLEPLTFARASLLLGLFALAVLFMFSQDFNPFLYFQF